MQAIGLTVPYLGTLQTFHGVNGKIEMVCFLKELKCQICVTLTVRRYTGTGDVYGGQLESAIPWACCALIV